MPAGRYTCVLCHKRMGPYRCVWCQRRVCLKCRCDCPGTWVDEPATVINAKKRKKP